MRHFLHILCFVGTLLPLFSASQNRYDILITECMPDPSPALGLPESSFIELKNRSTSDYNLHNWKISNGNSTVTIKSNFLLKADSFLILCPAASVTAYSVFGPALGISGFPALNNEAGDIILSSDSGYTIHAIHYDKDEYNNELKAAGGWSLEMIDPNNPCSGKENWTASISVLGGTPGKMNSVDARNPDEQPPALIRAVTSDSVDIILIFDEPIDSISSSVLNDYIFSDDMGQPVSAIEQAPFFNRLWLHLEKPLLPGKIYSLTLLHVSDCSGNEITLHNTCKIGIPEKVRPGDIIFNEILFNPPPDGFDYLELYNRSNKIISSAELFLAGRDFGGGLKNPVALVKEDRFIFPGEYVVITENPDWILHRFPKTDASVIIPLSALPSMPDDQGKIVLLNVSGETIDELDYDHHWHSPLLVNETGVALERIRADLPTSLASNWTSAATSEGYGTPGYKNSESVADPTVSDFISIDPKIFSPDMDGYQDFCFINYKLPAAGFIGSISIYDIYGRMVRKLVNNEIWPTSGSYRWDGLDDSKNLLSSGHYIIYSELFLAGGTVLKSKLVCTLAR